MQATLNLSKGFKTFGRELLFRLSQFPAGEQYINITVPDGVKSVRINLRGSDSDAIMVLILACDSLRRQGVQDIELFMPYLPYARQDRVCKKGDSFSLSVMCSIITSLRVRLVSYDVHSDVASILLDGHALTFYNNKKEFFSYIDSLYLRDGRDIVLICPDNGARKKTEDIFNSTTRFYRIVYCNKTRVGEHTVTVDKINCIDLNDTVAIVVDDICDGGGTFNALGHRLIEAGVFESHLFVSHGVFSKGINDLTNFYKTIGTTNSVNTIGLTPKGVRTFELDY